MLGGFRLTFQKKCFVWTLKGPQGRSIAINKTSWVIDGLKLWSFEILVIMQLCVNIDFANLEDHVYGHSSF